MLFALAFPFSACAQLTGSVSMGLQTTNNVQSLDTIAPDRILLPAFQLNYDVHPSGVSSVGLSCSIAPNYYHVNPGLSFNETTIGATGMFFLSNQDAISAEALEKGSNNEFKTSHSSHFRGIMNDNRLLEFPRPANPNPIPVPVPAPALQQQSKNDSLVDAAVAALYELSGELDSAVIPPKGLSKARVSELEELRDSISDVISTIADLLDSTGYSESASKVVVGELQAIRAPFLRMLPQLKSTHLESGLLGAAIQFLQQAKPEMDFLPTAPTPSALPGASAATSQLMHSLSTIVIPSGKNDEEALAPNLTLITLSTRMRTFGYNDVAIHEDADDSGARTMAMVLTVPVVYTNHAGIHYAPGDTVLFGGNYGGNPNDNKTLSFGAALEGLTSTSFSLRGSYDYMGTNFAFDSVYSNTENRLTLSPRLAVGRTTVLFGEAALGLRKYLDPLHLTDTLKGAKGRVLNVVNKSTGSNFTQFSFGLGAGWFLGERSVVGALMAFNINPNLRAYVTSAETSIGAKGKVRAAAQIADDEYTYDLSRYTLFTTNRIWGDLDLGIDGSYEHRKYGSAVGPKGGVLDSGRTENGTFLNASLSKLIPFEERFIGVFDALTVEAKLEWTTVASTQAVYGYQLTDVTLTATLTF